MPRRRQRLFEYRGHWIDGEAGTDRFYDFWYDKRSGTVRRKSLGTNDIEAAKEALIQRLTIEEPDLQSPDRALLSIVMERYLLTTDEKPSGVNNRLCAGHVCAHYGEDATISVMAPDAQRAFVRALSVEKGHSPAYIARTQAIVAAAVNYALKEGHLSAAPKIISGEKAIADILDVAKPGPREWVPTMEQLGRVYDYLAFDYQRRFMVLMLCTMARPDAVLDLSRAQRKGNVLDLNPAGRRQSNKYRPMIRVCDTLAAWLDHWETADVDEAGKPLPVPYVHYAGGRVGTMRKGFRLAGKELGFPMHQYAIRHFMATELHSRGAPAAQISEMLGHRDQSLRTTNWYIKFRPEFLADVSQAIDGVMSDLQRYCQRPLSSPNLLPSEI